MVLKGIIFIKRSNRIFINVDLIRIVDKYHVANFYIDKQNWFYIEMIFIKYEMTNKCEVGSE